MEPASRLLSLALKPLGRLYALVADQAGIDILGQGEVAGTRILPVHDQGQTAETLLFGVTTSAPGVVELLRIDIDFAVPLRLNDPAREQFFRTSMSSHAQLPFRLSWTGSLNLRRGLIAAFAVSVQVEERNSEHDVHLTSYARRIRTDFAGFARPSRTQVTSFERVVSFVRQPPLGISLPPNWELTTQQPYLVKGEWAAAGDTGAQFVVHELMEDGGISTVWKKLIGE